MADENEGRFTGESWESATKLLLATKVQELPKWRRKRRLSAVLKIWPRHLASRLWILISSCSFLYYRSIGFTNWRAFHLSMAALATQLVQWRRAQTTPCE